ncbi:YcaO-like family protein [Micromonospora craniellae]|uniref:YcaO domain-containing protein n=1 Tax=Micromonospora craniellae TaxID=2294034 RepID=A0A372FYJ8_9ACTN|nr:YcaO-like family protein [Micromonospora craniellae]QOC93440.1 YcaO-like family protein [Micromonospora craniellae]RFS45887.1 hypothetical protein D0Q02_14890 [Micromonospora craniellae]
MNGATPTPAVSRMLVDARCGIVRGIDGLALHPDLPSALKAAIASPSAYVPGAPAGHQASPGGAAWWQPEAAAMAALGETIERYCAHAVPAGLTMTSWNELHLQGTDAVDPHQLALYDDEQYAARGFPFTRFTRDDTVTWAAGSDTVTGAPVLVPASLVYFSPATRGRMPHLPVNAGLAAGHDLRDATLRALEETIERHCLATAWLAGAGFVDVGAPAWLVDVLGGTDLFELQVLHVPNPFALPVTVVLLRNSHSGLLGMGAALRPRRADAVAKAAAEAVVSYHAASQLDDEEILGGWLEGASSTALRPWRADRSYRQAYRADWRDVVDVFCHVQLYLDPAMWPPLRDRLSVTHAPDADRCVEAADREEYLKRLDAHGLRIVGVDLTTTDVRHAGLSAARVVVPGLRSTAPAAFPFLGGSWSLRRTGPACLLPLPHA